MIDIIKKAKNITRWSENLFTFVEIKDKNLYNMKNKNVKPIKGLIMKVNVSRKTKAVADEEKIRCAWRRSCSSLLLSWG